MNQTNFIPASAGFEKPPVELFPADPSNTLTGELDGEAAGGNPTTDIIPMRENKTCATHHFACACREASFAKSEKVQASAREWMLLNDSGLRLRCGELTAAEIRTIRAVVAYILNQPTTDAT